MITQASMPLLTSSQLIYNCTRKIIAVGRKRGLKIHPPDTGNKSKLVLCHIMLQLSSLEVVDFKLRWHLQEML